MSATAILARWREDPLLFCHDVFPPGEWPREWQTGYLDSLANRDLRRVAARVCRDGGKSRALAYAALHHLCTNPDSLVLIVAPIQRQVRTSIWTEIKILWQASDVLRGLFPEWQLLDSEMRVPDRAGWRMIGVSSDDPGNLEGFHGKLLLLIVDEAQALPDGHWTGLQGTNPSRVLLGGRGGRPEGFLYRVFAHDGRERFDKLFTITGEMIPRLRDVVARERARLGSGDSQFRAQWLCEFVASAVEGLYDLGTIDPCLGWNPDDRDTVTLNGVPLFGVPRRRVMALDPARSGDSCVLCYSRGRVIERFEILPHAPEMQTAGATIQRIHQYRPQEFVGDTIGLGAGIFSRIQEVLEAERFETVCTPFNASERASDNERFYNKKTEVAVGIRKLLQERELGLPRDERLVRELLGMSLRMMSNGRMKLEDPKDSPDFFDAMLMAVSPRVVEPDVVSYKSIDPEAVPILTGPLLRGGR